MADQRRRPDSLLSRLERAIRVRKECPEMGFGSWAVLGSGDDRVLAHRCDWLEGTVVALHNLSADEVEVQLELDDADGMERLVDLLGSDEYEQLPVDAPTFSMPPHAYRWLRAQRPGSGLPR